MPPVSPLAPARFPQIGRIAGVRLAAGAAGIRYRGRDDVALLVVDEGTTVAGVLTTSLTCGHPVAWCRRVLAQGRARAVIVNAGNANVLVGPAGDAAVREEAAAVAGLLGCDPDMVLVCSTGVIGEPLDASRIVRILPELHASLADDAWERAARAICTTDTFPKGAVREAAIGDVSVRIAGIAKGSGMIAPNMATMLAYVATDAAMPAHVLQALLERAVDRSFHAITVDGDTSTSDTVLLLATGRAGNVAPQDPNDPSLTGFAQALDEVARDLAIQVVRDGEGAQKLVTIGVTGALDDASARRLGLVVANSPLVKTAIAGGDANWGRVVMAVGKAGEPIEPDRLAIAFGGRWVAREGRRVEDLDEAPVAAHLAGREVRIDIEVGIGEGRATVWTCDLTRGYVDINADYRS